MGRHIQATSAQSLIGSIHQQSAEVLTQAHITNRNIEINLNLFKIENSNLELFKNMNLQIKRFSASVFAIRLSLEQNVIFQGVFSFLHDRADDIINNLKTFVKSVKNLYSTTVELIHDVERLAEIGDRFTKQVWSFITHAFGTDNPIEEKDIKFGIQNLSQGEAVLYGSLTGRNTATLGGKNGNVWLVDTSTGRIISSGKAGRGTIQAIAAVSDEYVAIGTDEGLDLFAGIGRDQEQLRGSYNEKITAVVAPLWGGRGVAVVTGSSDGYMRRWSLAQRLTRDPVSQSQVTETRLQRYSDTGSHIVEVCKLNDRVFCVGSEDGKMRAISSEGGEELGSIDLDMHIRGLIHTGSRILAFGGGWNSPRGRSVALVTWDAIVP